MSEKESGLERRDFERLRHGRRPAVLGMILWLRRILRGHHALVHEVPPRAIPHQMQARKDLDGKLEVGLAQVHHAASGVGVASALRGTKSAAVTAPPVAASMSATASQSGFLVPFSHPCTVDTGRPNKAASAIRVSFLSALNSESFMRPVLLALRNYAKREFTRSGAQPRNESAAPSANAEARVLDVS